jgi:NitT/TauT family transport system substrate-binding protein
MRRFHTRRRFLTNLAGAGAGIALLPRRAAAAEPPPETATVRFGKISVICFAPQYVCEELLRAEGFTDIRYVNTEPLSYSTDLGRGKYDFCANVTPAHIAAFAAGTSMAILSGVHAGCYELFGRDGIRGIADLKGKRVGTGAAADLIEIMAAYVGLDPKKDVTIVTDPSGKTL